jgi:phage-related protein
VNKQDRTGVRTAQDIERKYDLSDLVGVKKAVEHNEETLNKTNAELENFMKETLDSIGDLQHQLDGSLVTYYHSGVPTLTNYPTNEWPVEDYPIHVGNMYYDKDTGYAYRFFLDGNTYRWIKIADSDVEEAMRLASLAQDTADGKRRVFTTTPFVPYDVGDLWLRNKDLYVCKTSKTATEQYGVDDFEKATKYTDDTELNNFVSGTYKDDLKTINDSIDKKAETWFQSTDPSVNWTTTGIKSIHVGDLWYNTTAEKSYLYTSSYTWEEVDGVPDKVYDAIDGKAQIFTTTPTTPYYVGDLYVQGGTGDILVCKKERLTGSYTASEWEKASKYTDDSALRTFIVGEYADDLEQINETIDKKAETWYQAANPATNWTTTEQQNAHIGDLWFNTSENKSYIYNSSREWKEANGVPDSVYDKIDGKSQIFTSQPTTPYRKGDLYTQGTNGDILVCTKDRLTGSYTAGDWIKAGKYTDDTALNKFVNEIYPEDLAELTNQIDGKITTWYLTGVPTLTNAPANEWATEDYIKHSGDLYYDKATGYTYTFQITEGSYGWVHIVDTDLTDALAKANAAQDTADNKRRVFLAPPLPPYDNGDLWFNDGEIYVCQIAKLAEEEVYTEGDFIIATKYTDDSLAMQNGEELTVLKGTVATIKESTDEYKIQFDTTIKTIHNETKETTESLKSMAYSFGTEALRIATSDDPVNATFDNRGVKVNTYKELNTIMNEKGLGTNKLIVVQEAQIGNLRINKAIDEKGKPCTDFHHLISTIQKITDLE